MITPERSESMTGHYINQPHVSIELTFVHLLLDCEVLNGNFAISEFYCFKS